MPHAPPPRSNPLHRSTKKAAPTAAFFMPPVGGPSGPMLFATHRSWRRHHREAEGHFWLGRAFYSPKVTLCFAATPDRSALNRDGKHGAASAICMRVECRACGQAFFLRGGRLNGLARRSTRRVCRRAALRPRRLPDSPRLRRDQEPEPGHTGPMLSTPVLRHSAAAQSQVDADRGRRLFAAAHLSIRGDDARTYPSLEVEAATVLIRWLAGPPAGRPSSGRSE